jgi:hypothetical protein
MPQRRGGRNELLRHAEACAVEGLPGIIPNSVNEL